ncbi:MAG: hypothetical protein H6821_03075 [Planctomycetaceae bacterium]|nr:hypothetical protein [Planctomycetaceae bacterium]
MPLHRNSILWTGSQIDRLTAGTWLSGCSVDWLATGVRREPQHVAAGDLFITAGPVGREVVTSDVNQLFARGAVAVITSVPPTTNVLWGPVRLVADTNQVYEALAADSLSRNTTQIVAVTGSVGKTGTKDAIAHVLSHQGTVLSNPRSANSDTVILELLCQLAPNVDYAIAELGMLGPHSITRKAALCQPHVAVITSINAAHRKHHRSDISIAETKSEILDGIRPGGTAVLPRDSSFFEYLLKRAEAQSNIKRVLTFGRHTDADVRLVKQSSHADSTDVEIDCCGQQLCYRVGLPGGHHALNSLAVWAVVSALGADSTLAAMSLSSLPPTFRRCERFRVERPEGVCEVIDDSWNASPESVAAAIELLSRRPIPAGGRRVLILGDMLELGPNERALHRSLAEPINSGNIDIVFTAGDLTRELHDALPSSRQGGHFRSSRELAAQLDRLIQAGDSLLVKGSNAMEMVRVVSAALRGKPRSERIASRYWNLAVEQQGCDHDAAQQANCDQEHEAGAQGKAAKVSVDAESFAFLNRLRDSLQGSELHSTTLYESDVWQLPDRLSKTLWGFVITLYQPGAERLMVARVESKNPFDNVRRTVERVRLHPRFSEFDLSDWSRCRMQVDFIVNEPELVELATLSDSAMSGNLRCHASLMSSGADEGRRIVLGAHHTERDGYFMTHHTERDGCAEGAASPWLVQVTDWTDAVVAKNKKQLTRFELGVDGLRIVAEGKRRYFLPGDAFVKSILGIGQLRRHIQRLFPGDDIESLTYYRFRSLSFVSAVDVGSAVRTGTVDADSTVRTADRTNWLPLYRGLPPIPEVNGAALTQAARAGTKWIADSIQPDGRFIYYYDAATDTRRDHEHPNRDFDTDPYYNLLRHGGGAITLLLDGQLEQQKRDQGPGCDRTSNDNLWRDVIERSLDFFVRQLVEYRTAHGDQAAYAFYNRKAKLGGSGIGLCALAMYQHIFQDSRYALDSLKLVDHLCNEINDQGEFRYYHIYLDEPVAWKDNQKYFSFYYPGEAILGLSQYSQHVCNSEADRRRVFDKLHLALRFLLRDRPQLHKEHYQSLPSDSWLMMGINDLWDVAEFREVEYKRFVFDDADQMVRLMYTEEDALYPDYVGSFYYQYGDHPFPDGARAEGLMAAYQLALKVGDQQRIERYREACVQVARATLRLCNTRESAYSAPNPDRTVGGIRFKLTRQWFRIDTIQHVASFYLKLLATNEFLPSASDVAEPT